jgi:hypothetical protein
MDMQTIIAELTRTRDQLNARHESRQPGEPVDLVRACRIDLLNTAILSLHHYSAPDGEIRKALSL